MRRIKIIFLCALFFATSAFADQDFSKVEIQTINVAPNVFMLTGAGGNMGLCIGKNGNLLIDDQFAPMTGNILSAIAKISDQPVKFVINTHWHFDHTGGNENIAKTGTIIIAHENVRKRMSTPQMITAFNKQIPASTPQALPVVTFSEAMNFYWDDETMEIIHFPLAHSDGDAVIFFKAANVIHAGDIFFNGIYPFIDVERGGSIDGMIQTVEQILKRTDKQTKIIPGHGALADIAELKEYKQMLSTVRDRIAALKNQGKTKEQIIAAKPTADLDAKWGKGFLTPDMWVAIAYSAVK